MTRPTTNQQAFTLVEMVIVIAATGVMAAAVALFLRWPFQAYLDAARRAELTDTADTALRRMGRDLRIALPNSVRIAAPAGATCVEMLPTITGGRYRAAQDGTVPPAPPPVGDILDFNFADASFDMLGPLPVLPGQVIVTGQRVAIYNLGATSVGSDAYNGTNTNVIARTDEPGTLLNESKITFSGVPQLFPLASPGNRFQVIAGPVSYVCTPGAVDASGNGTGTLTRVSGYGIAAPQVCPPGGTAAPLVNNVTGCDIQYTPLGATARNAIVSMTLALTQSNETVSLYHEAHVSNAP